MLINLHVKNLALIEETDVDFAGHLNILTGETGAGKSILIGSIQSALGSKIPKDMIRKGCDSALIELVFHTESDVVRQKMDEFDIPFEDGEIIISRRITNNRVINKVNDTSVTAARLKELSPFLLDLSGQHENQLLLKPQNHLRILDDYGGEEIAAAKKETAGLFGQYQETRRLLKEENIGEEERLREIEFLKYEIQEITGAALREGEDEELESLFEKISHSRDILAACGSVYDMTSGNAASAESILGKAIRSLSDVTKYDEGVSSLMEELSTVDGLLNDFNRDLSEYMSSMEFDEETYAQTEERLDLIHRLKAKYGDSVSAILSYREKAESRLSNLENLDERIAELKMQQEKLQSSLTHTCEHLTALRQRAAQPLADSIKEALLDLNFNEVRFEIAVTPGEVYRADGWDQVCFMISTNPGMDVRPLQETASGGELSRIMLAIKSVLADEEEVETLIFDEIDAGISGRTAQKVSERLAQIARKRQVIAITHLPQIAAMADAHYLIEKTSDNNSTISRICLLSEDASVEELARMLGGAEITSTVLDNAREMKKFAEELTRSMS